MSDASSNDIKWALYSVITRIMTPLAAILIRNGIPFRVFSELAKQAYLRAATDNPEFSIPGKKQTLTRIATITGIPRKEVGQIKENAGLSKNKLYSMQRHSRAARVISAWIRETDFHNKLGKPASLVFEGEQRSFSELVRRSGADVTPRTVLDELIRSGTVGILKNGNIALLKDSYVPEGDDLEKIGMLGTDVRDLIKTINHNLSCPPEDAFFQRKALYDNVPVERLEKLRLTLRRTAQTVLEQFDREIAAADRDANKSLKGTGRMIVGMNLYYFEEEYQENREDDAHQSAY